MIILVSGLEGRGLEGKFSQKFVESSVLLSRLTLFMSSVILVQKICGSLACVVNQARISSQGGIPRSSEVTDLPEVEESQNGEDKRVLLSC